jgi:hypothetical protein
MALKIVTISDGFESSTIPNISVPTVATSVTVYGELTAPQILAGKVVLPTTPENPTQAIMMWSGISQFYGKDFNVSGTDLNFLSRLLPLLEVNDEIIILYS